MTANTEALVDKLSGSGPMVPVAEAWQDVVGRPLARRTRERVTTEGLNGIVLPTLMICGRRCTTAAAVRAWLAETNEVGLR